MQASIRQWPCSGRTAGQVRWPARRSGKEHKSCCARVTGRTPWQLRAWPGALARLAAVLQQLCTAQPHTAALLLHPCPCTSPCSACQPFCTRASHWAFVIQSSPLNLSSSSRRAALCVLLVRLGMPACDPAIVCAFCFCCLSRLAVRDWAVASRGVGGPLAACSR